MTKIPKKRASVIQQVMSNTKRNKDAGVIQLQGQKNRELLQKVKRTRGRRNDTSRPYLAVPEPCRSRAAAGDGTSSKNCICFVIPGRLLTDFFVIVSNLASSGNAR